MKILYLDESGTSNLRKFDDSYPIFLLGGVIIDAEDIADNQRLMNDFKVKYWGRDEIILHSCEIVHRIREFEMLKNPEVWANFVTDLNELMENLKYRVIACIIDIPKTVAKYRRNAVDPYEYALRIVLERFVYFMTGYEDGKVLAESRGKILDIQLAAAFEKIRETGTGFVCGDEIRDKINGFEIHEKCKNITGLQIADLVLSPIGRNYLGKKVNQDYNIVYQKCLCKYGKVEGNGIIVLPKE